MIGATFHTSGYSSPRGTKRRRYIWVPNDDDGQPQRPYTQTHTYDHDERCIISLKTRSEATTLRRNNTTHGVCDSGFLTLAFFISFSSSPPCFTFNATRLALPEPSMTIPPQVLDMIDLGEPQERSSLHGCETRWHFPSHLVTHRT